MTEELYNSLRELHDWMREHAGYAESVEMLTRSHDVLRQYETLCALKSMGHTEPGAVCLNCDVAHEIGHCSNV